MWNMFHSLKDEEHTQKVNQKTPSGETTLENLAYMEE